MQFKGLMVPFLYAHALKRSVSTKIVLVMKLVSVILLAFVMQLSAKTAAQTVTYTAKAVPLQQVFTTIKAQTGYKFFYRNEDLEGLKPVDVALKNAAPEAAVRAVLSGQPLEFTMEGKTIFVSKKAPKPLALGLLPEEGEQVVTGEVKGAVRDEAGKPIPAITILAKRSRIMTMSGDDGQFRVANVVQGDSLVFSGLNYETTTIPATFSGTVLVIMRTRITALTGVMIYNTGYQQLSKERATGAFSKPDMEVFRNRVVTNDIMSRLDGQIAGLTVIPGDFMQSQNRNGVTTNKVVIRGISSVAQDVNPLYVVNGMVVTDFSTVNPQDIEDITVLKDAAASAIYGARATNGVVVVHTKQGRKNQRVQVNYNGNYSFQGKPDLDYVPYMNSRQLVQAARENFSPEIYPYESFTYRPMMPHNKILYDQYRGLISAADANRKLDSLSSIDNMSQIKDLIYNNAMSTNHTVSASGGTGNYSFYASLGYSGNQSSKPGEKSNSYKLNLSQDINAGKRVNIRLSTSLISSEYKSNGAVTVGRDFLPYQLFRDANGNDINMTGLMSMSDSLRQDYQDRSRINLDYYPLRESKYYTQRTNNLYMNVTAGVSVKLWKGLSFEGLYGYIKSPGKSESYSDNRGYYQRQQLVSFTIAPTVGSTPQYLLPLSGGTYSVDNTDQRNWTVRNQLVYNIQPRHGKDILSLQLGQEAQEAVGSYTTTTIIGYDRQLVSYPQIDYFTLGQGVPGTVTGYGFLGTRPFEANRSVSRYSSYIFMGSYTFDHKYSLDVNWRRDHSNLFGSDLSAQNKPAYSFGAKWQLSREAFMQQVSWINDLGIRATYGITGNSPAVGQAASSDVLTSIPQSNSGGIAGDAFEVTTVANRKLAWEKTQTVNIGIDFSLLEGRLNGGINGYHKTTTNLLGTVPTNRFTGFDRTFGNLGKLLNKGIELSLHTQNIKGENFGWSTSLVFSYNKNKLANLGVISATAYVNTLYGRLFSSYLPGRSMQSLFAYQFAGLDALGDPQIYLNDKTITKNPNAAAAKDLVYQGTMQPVFNGGFTNTFNYKTISLSVNMIYNLGHVMRRDVNTLYSGVIGDGSSLASLNVSSYFLDRWQQPGDENKTNVPAYVADEYTNSTRRNTGYYQYGDVNVVKASYVKVRDITLSYGLTPPALRFLKLQGLDLFVQATNFMVWKANKNDIDPEFFTLQAGTRMTPAVKHGYNVGLNITL